MQQLAAGAIPQAAVDLAQTYLHLEGGGRAVTMPLTPQFWPTLMSGEGGDAGARYLRAAAPGWLVGIFPLEGDPDRWEMHPSGDEILYLIAGEMTVVLEEKGAERRVDLVAGDTCFVPRGAWHTFRIRKPGALLALTYGAGTEHRPA
jgi:mannose-6-phosphate isomerase-like protein (cupin superfamily)